jgi:hypothetical protein
MRVIVCLVALGVVLPAVAWADGNSGAPDDDLEIGGINTYATETEARSACGGDTVVWADRYAGYYFFPREAQYGHTSQGAFACWHNAKKGNYWDTSPMSSMGEAHPGRQFPQSFTHPLGS